MEHPKPSFSSEVGKGKIKSLLWIAVIGLVLSLLVQILPAYYDRLGVRSAIESVARVANVGMEKEEIEELLRKAYKNKRIFVHNPADIKINRRYGRLTLTYRYEENISFPFTSFSFPLVMEIEE